MINVSPLLRDADSENYLGAKTTFQYCLTHVAGLRNRRLLEQTFILLLGTYGEKLLSPEALTTSVDFSHYYLFQEDATMLNTTAIRLFNEVDWTQFRLRRGFVGLNTASPITETHSYSDRPIWVCSTELTKITRATVLTYHSS